MCVCPLREQLPNRQACCPWRQLTRWPQIQFMPLRRMNLGADIEAIADLRSKLSTATMAGESDRCCPQRQAPYS